MSITKVTSNTLASGAALANLNQESSIVFIKSVSTSGSISASSIFTSSTAVADSLVVDGNTLVVDNNNVGIGTSTPTANLEVAGTVVIQDDAVFNGTENTMPNQTLNSGGDSAITLDLLLRSDINYGWEPVFITGTYESPSTANMTQTLTYNVLTLAATSVLSGYVQGGLITGAQLNYPTGSGRSNKFTDPFTLSFWWNFNTASSAVEHWFAWGRTSSTTSYPSGSEDILAVKIAGMNVTAYIMDGSGTPVESAPGSLGTYNLHNRTKICIVWDGTTLSVYGKSRIGYGYAENSWNVDLLCTVTYPGTLPTYMDSFNAVFFEQYLEALSSNFATAISNIKFIRRAVHPI